MGDRILLSAESLRHGSTRASDAALKSQTLWHFSLERGATQVMLNLAFERVKPSENNQKNRYNQRDRRLLQ